MAKPHLQKFFTISITAHVILLIVLMLGLDFSSPMPVFENTNKQDVISAVVLGDTAKSKILPSRITKPSQPKRVATKPILKPEPVPTPTPPKLAIKSESKAVPEIKPETKEVIALKPTQKKEIIPKKIDTEKEAQKKQELLANDLLADIKKHSEQQKKVKQKALKSQFEKLLHEEAEQSLRQQLLNEEIKLKGTISRQAQGEVNKYQALIIQAISQNWVIPTSANKKLSCELMIRLASDGMVLDVQVLRSSGDPALDSSARSAVFKSSPLPVPTDPEALKPFKQFTLKVKPENILSDNG